MLSDNVFSVMSMLTHEAVATGTKQHVFTVMEVRMRVIPLMVKHTPTSNLGLLT